MKHIRDTKHNTYLHSSAKQMQTKLQQTMSMTCKSQQHTNRSVSNTIDSTKKHISETKLSHYHFKPLLPPPPPKKKTKKTKNNNNQPTSAPPTPPKKKTSRRFAEALRKATPLEASGQGAPSSSRCTRPTWPLGRSLFFFSRGDLGGEGDFWLYQYNSFF